MKRVLVTLCAIVLLALGATAFAEVDDFEDTAPIYTQIDTRVIEGVTVSISNARDMPFLSVIYYDPNSPCFLGHEDEVNAPTDPALVSGSLFISTADDINKDMPIAFDFSTPVATFGLTTIDVLEDVATSVDAEVTLQGFRNDVLVDEHAYTGIQGGSGIVLQWEIGHEGGIDRAILIRTAGTISAGYGIDDLVLVTMPVATDRSTFGAVKALYR